MHKGCHGRQPAICPRARDTVVDQDFDLEDAGPMHDSSHRELVQGHAGATYLPSHVVFVILDHVRLLAWAAN